MLREQWVAAHPYLRTLAEFSAQVESTLTSIEVPVATPPEWGSYHADYLAGVPLLASGHAAMQLEPGGRAAATLIERLASADVHERLTSELRTLIGYLHASPDPPQRIVEFLFEEQTDAVPFPGLLRYLSWTAMARYLRPAVTSFDAARDDEQWHRGYCPGCGSLPAMAQLVGVDHGRKRLLSCGCCGLRWQFKRTACPFCEEESPSLATVKIEIEPALRIDYCSQCSGYLKTYAGQGDEALMLADWSSLHLDLVAHERGLIRRAASLYQFESRESATMAG